MTEDPYDYDEKECPTCGVMAPAAQIENHGHCERHEIDGDRGTNKDDKVDHGISIIEEKWKPKVIEEKGRDAV